MKRYLKIYYMILKTNLKVRFAYRTNLLSSFVANVGWGIFSLIAIFILSSKTSGILGWTPNELILLVSLNAVFTGIFHFFVSANFFKWADTVNRGKLDSILLLPLDSQFSMSLWHSEPMSFFRILLGVIVTGYLVLYLKISVSFFQILFTFVLIIIANIIFYSLWFLCMTVVIWFTNLSNLVYFLDSFISYTRYPKEIYQNVNNLFFFLFIPIALLGSTPTRALLNKSDMNDLFLFFILAFVMFLSSRIFWRFALRSYTSAS